MKLVRGILVKGLVVTSVVLLLTTAAMWVRSHRVRDYGFVWVVWPGDEAGRRWVKLDGDSGGGQVEISWKVWTDADRRLLQKESGLGAAAYHYSAFDDVPRSYARSYPPTEWNAIGFRWYSGATHSSVCFPYWLVLLVCAGAPAAWWMGRRRRRQRLELERAGRCVGCGYDLRATPERCPECGLARTNA